MHQNDSEFSLAVFDLKVFNGELIAAGSFTHAGGNGFPDGIESPNIARWDGAEWHAMGSGTNDAATTLHQHNDELIVGGWFNMAGDRPNGHLARWGALCQPGDANQDGVVDVDDLIAVILNWGACAQCDNCAADFDDDCAVEVDDLIAVILNWGQP